MEAGAIVALVLGSNAIMGLVNWFVTRMQIKNSENQFEKRMQAQREADEHKRRWEVKSWPLLELRAEVARMAEKLEKIVGFATKVPIIDGLPLESDGNFKSSEKALEDWNDYVDSGGFYRVEHMQYDHELKREAHKILHGYGSAYEGVLAFWKGERAKEEINKAEAVIKENAHRISALQLKINELLEEL